jgi:hypothetical protein
MFHSYPDNVKMLLAFAALLNTINACTKRIDSTRDNNPCTDSCTIVQGRFVTGDNEPIRGVPLKIQSEIKPTLGLGQTTIRKIVTGKTDNNGFYSLKFGLNEQEYGLSAKAVVSLHFNYDKFSFQPVS